MEIGLLDFSTSILEINFLKAGPTILWDFLLNHVLSNNSNLVQSFKNMMAFLSSQSVPLILKQDRIYTETQMLKETHTHTK